MLVGTSSPARTKFEFLSHGSLQHAERYLLAASRGRSRERLHRQTQKVSPAVQTVHSGSRELVSALLRLPASRCVAALSGGEKRLYQSQPSLS